MPAYNTVYWSPMLMQDQMEMQRNMKWTKLLFYVDIWRLYKDFRVSLMYKSYIGDI